MKISILGGGFGLYGYLPALCEIPETTIILPIRYKERIQARNDISHLYHNIEWAEDEETLLQLCEGIIIALPPVHQYTWVKRCLEYDNVTHMLLEKPLAASPTLAKSLLDDLKYSGKKFRLGYNFRYTDWGKAVLKNVRGLSSVTWNFRAHHYAHNVHTWKRRHDEGGGALRFYGIHLIALLAERGYSSASYSQIHAKQNNQAESWEAEITGTDLLPCKIHINSNCNDTQFIVQDACEHPHSLLQPFSVPENHEQTEGDQRIPFLRELLKDMLFNEDLYYDWNQKTNLLWEEIEKRTSVS